MKLEIGSRKHSERLINKPTADAFAQIQPMAGLQIRSERYFKTSKGKPTLKIMLKNYFSL